MMTKAMRQFSTTTAGGAKPVVAIAGITGAVGQELLNLITERKFEFSELRPLASKRSAGKKFTFQGKEYTIQELTENSFDGVDITFFSAGGSVSKQFAPLAGKARSNNLFGPKNIVIDNSSAFRMTPEIPLIVPEVNPHHLSMIDKLDSKIIANPNCSTIIMNLAVYPLHKLFNVKRAVVSTYQAASGAGAEAMRELETQAREIVNNKQLTTTIFKKQYIFNLFSHNSKIYEDNGYNEEEIKMLKETRKIFDDNNIRVTATCVRVPVLRAHCESINLEFEKKFESEAQIRKILSAAPGVKIVDDRVLNEHPEPLKASGKDEVLIGRIRKDISQDDGYGLDMFVAGDQIRKGAALNAIQIAELIMQR